MKFQEYLTEAKMPKKQLDYFQEIVDEFLASCFREYKYKDATSFIKDLEKYDYKTLSVLFGDLGVTSITDFVKKYRTEIEDEKFGSNNEAIDWQKDWSSPEQKAIKAKFGKKLSIVSAKAQYGKTEYIVKLVSGKWPKEFDIIKFCDASADFGGKVVDGINKDEKYVYINDN